MTEPQVSFSVVEEKKTKKRKMPCERVSIPAATLLRHISLGGAQASIDVQGLLSLVEPLKGKAQRKRKRGKRGGRRNKKKVNVASEDVEMKDESALPVPAPKADKAVAEAKKAKAKAKKAKAKAKKAKKAQMELSPVKDLLKDSDIVAEPPMKKPRLAPSVQARKSAVYPECKETSENEREVVRKRKKIKRTPLTAFDSFVSLSSNRYVDFDQEKRMKKLTKKFNKKDLDEISIYESLAERDNREAEEEEEENEAVPKERKKRSHQTAFDAFVSLSRAQYVDLDQDKRIGKLKKKFKKLDSSVLEVYEFIAERDNREAETEDERIQSDVSVVDNSVSMKSLHESMEEEGDEGLVEIRSIEDTEPPKKKSKPESTVQVGRLSEKELGCLECDYRTRFVNAWYLHLRSKHSTNPTLCDGCRYTLRKLQEG